MSKTYSLKTVQRFPSTIDNVWDFFSSPHNLKDITPAHLSFKVINDGFKEKMYPGQIIEYKVSPLLHIPVYWMTEITHVEEKKFFVDEQRFGPYNLWHHQHHFEVIEGGVQMTDIVHYRIPFWFAGDIANTLFVRKQLREIFEYRYKKTESIFGKWQNDTLDIIIK